MLTDDNAARFLSVDGELARGVKQIVTVPNPAAHTDWSAVVPGGEQWKVLAAVATFTADATVANRTPRVSITIDGVLLWLNQDNAAVAATGIVQYFFTPADPPAVISHGGNIMLMTYPHLLLPPGAVFGTSTVNITTNDQWSGIGLWVERHYMTDQQADSYAVEDLTRAVELLQQIGAKT